MTVNIKDLTTKMNGFGIEFTRIVRKSPLLSVLLYDPSTLYSTNGSGKDLKPKSLERTRYVLEDGRSFKWRDIDLRPKGTTAAANAAIGATAVTVADASLITAADQIYHPTSGQTRTVTSISGDVLTISPALTVAITSGDPIKLVSYSVALGGTGKNVSMELNDENTNYLQDTSINLPFTQDELNKLYMVYASQGMSDDEIVSKMIQEDVGHARSKIIQSIAAAFYVGHKHQVTVGSKTRHFAGGFREFYTTNTNCTGATAEAAWQNILTALRPVQEIDTQDGAAGETVLVCSPAAAEGISALSRKLDLLRDKQETNFLGTVITELRTINGTIRLLADTTIQDLEGDSANVAYAFKPGLVRLVSSPREMTIKDVSQDAVRTGMYEGITLHMKPQDLPNAAEIEAFTNFSFIFGGSSVGAGVRLYNVGVVSS